MDKFQRFWYELAFEKEYRTRMGNSFQEFFFAILWNDVIQMISKESGRGGHMVIGKMMAI